jgi:peptidoglycan/LPS O-acetylase OafA/YrhL
MVTLGGKISSGTGNDLNAIRLILALIVMVSHAFPLSLGGDGESKGEPLFALTHGQLTCGSFAVDLFFFISGLLITASWLRSRSMQDYLMKRILRIYPAFIGAVLFTAVVTWIACPAFRPTVSSASWWMALVKDCLFLTQNSLSNWAGIFPSNPYPGYANGSLWTIPREFQCYLLVAVMGLFCLFKRRSVILCLTLTIVLWYAKYLLAGASVEFLDSRFLSFFLMGMGCWLWRDKIPMSPWMALGSFVLLLITSQLKPWFSILLPPLGGYVILWLGYGMKTDFLAWTRKMDISYGTYLFAFPIQQLVAMHPSLRSPWINFVISVPITLGLAWISWHLVEKRFLAMKKIPLVDYDPGDLEATRKTRPASLS